MKKLVSGFINCWGPIVICSAVFFMCSVFLYCLFFMAPAEVRERKAKEEADFQAKEATLLSRNYHIGPPPATVELTNSTPIYETREVPALAKHTCGCPRCIQLEEVIAKLYINVNTHISDEREAWASQHIVNIALLKMIHDSVDDIDVMTKSIMILGNISKEDLTNKVSDIPIHD